MPDIPMVMKLLNKYGKENFRMMKTPGMYEVGYREYSDAYPNGIARYSVWFHDGCIKVLDRKNNTKISEPVENLKLLLRNFKFKEPSMRSRSWDKNKRSVKWKKV